MSLKIKNQFTCSRMMLPEHCSEISAHRASVKWQEQYRRPLVDEQRAEELQHALERAMAEGLLLEITLLNESGFHTYGGRPLKAEQHSGTIIVDGGTGCTLKIKAGEITDLKFV